jgi:beta-lactamase superfamily II metal-dependent hydrolase
MGESEMTTSKKAAGKKSAGTKKSAGGKKAAAASKKAGPGKSAPKKGAAAASQAKGLRVRMYRVGFGDFFLVIVPTAEGDRHIVIDCGVFKGTSQTGDIGTIEDAVEDLYKTTGGKLSLVIMTHRHADHIAGFSRAAETFRKFEASMVWMPYWEQFNDQKGSAHSLQAEVEQLAMQLAMQFRGREDAEARTALYMLSDATGVDFNAAPAGTKKLSGNALALDLLKNHLGKNGENVRYYAAGDEPELPSELKGLKAAILGPPPKEAQVFMKLEDLKKGVGQYLDSATGGDGGASAILPFRKQWWFDPAKEYRAPDPNDPKSPKFKPVDFKAAAGIVDGAQPDMLAAAAKKIDNFLNNQSLVVLFTFGGKKLLFVGDAQAGNWEHWLYRVDAPDRDPTKLGDIVEESRDLLANIDFYKVGHHGSTNATPIQAVEAIGGDRPVNSVVAMCSTEVAVYGNPDKGTEVPRDPLLEALGSRCALVRSDAIEVEGGGVKYEAVSSLPKPKAGKLRTSDLYIEYSF